MIINFIFRTILGAIVLGVLLLYGSKDYIRSNFTDPSAEKIAIQDYFQGFKNLLEQRGNDTGPQIPFRNRLYPVYLTDNEDGYLIEAASGDVEVFLDDDLGKYYLILDSAGNPVSSSEGKRVYSVEYTHQQAIWFQSLVRIYFLHYVLGVLLVLGILKDLIGRRSDRSSTSAPALDREKQGMKIFAALAKAVDKENLKKVKILLETEKAAEFLPRKSENGELILGKALLLVGDDEKALPVLRRFATKNRKDTEVQKVLGGYFLANPKDARIQDLPYLLKALDEGDVTEEMEKLVSNLVLKYKIKDRKSLHSVSKICTGENANPELIEHILSTFLEFKDFDETAQDFYQFCRGFNPEDPRPLLMQAESSLAAGHFQEALGFLEPLLSMDYENQRIHEMLFKIYEVLERLDDLYKVYQSILGQHPEEPIALAQQREIRSHPDFKLEESDQGSTLSVEELLAKSKDGKGDAEDVLLKKYERTLSILFTDIEGYTRMSESQSIVETMAILQESDQIIAPIIKKHEGVVIKKIGDAYMARFDSADSAIMAGIQIQQAIYSNNQKRSEADQITWNIRIGINTGPVFVKDGDVFGDAVNIASRVESNARSGEVYCTRETADSVSSSRFQFESRDRRRVKGKSEPIELLSVLFDATAQKE